MFVLGNFRNFATYLVYHYLVTNGELMTKYAQCKGASNIQKLVKELIEAAIIASPAGYLAIELASQTLGQVDWDQLAEKISALTN